MTTVVQFHLLGRPDNPKPEGWLEKFWKIVGDLPGTPDILFEHVNQHVCGKDGREVGYLRIVGEDVPGLRERLNGLGIPVL